MALPRRPVGEIHFTKAFEDSFRKLPQQVRLEAVEREKWFRENCNDNRLYPHMINKNERLHSFRISKHNPPHVIIYYFSKEVQGRVVFIYADEEKEAYRKHAL